MEYIQYLFMRGSASCWATQQCGLPWVQLQPGVQSPSSEGSELRQADAVLS